MGGAEAADWSSWGRIIIMTPLVLNTLCRNEPLPHTTPCTTPQYPPVVPPYHVLHLTWQPTKKVHFSASLHWWIVR